MRGPQSVQANWPTGVTSAAPVPREPTDTTWEREFVQINANKCKQMSLNVSKIASVY
jgi:hypothetical protein